MAYLAQHRAGVGFCHIVEPYFYIARVAHALGNLFAELLRIAVGRNVGHNYRLFRIRVLILAPLVVKR